MKIFVNICLIFFLVVVAAFAERVVIPESEVERVGLENILSKPSAKLIRKSKLGVYIFEIELEDLKELGIKEYKVEEKTKLISSLPNDPDIDKQWSIFKTSLDELWDEVTDCTNVIIAVVDTGIDYNHIDLVDNIYINENEICDNDFDDDGNGYVDDCLGWDFENNDNDPLDDNSHGTHVAGIIGAVGDNGIGVSGVCQRARLLAVKALDDKGEGYDYNLADGIIYAVDRGAKIINLSLESDKKLPFTYEAISYAEEKGAIVVIASGNNSLNLNVTKSFPATYSLDFDNVVTVSSSNEGDKIGTKSNYGSITVDIFAPGENIISTYPDDYLAYKTGTSMAAPFISGVVGLLLSFDNTLTPFDVKKRVIASADTVSDLKGLSVSGGRINASKILDSVNRPIILKVYPESFGVSGDEDVRPNLNEPLEIYGAVDEVYGVYYNYNGNDNSLNFEKVDSKTIKVHTPIVSGDFYIKTLNSSGYSNEVKISPYLNKINLNNAVYAIEPIESKNSDAKIIEILYDDVVDNYTVVGEGFSFYISGDTVSGINIVKTTSTNANTNGAALLKTDNGAIICLEKKDNTYYTSNISTNKDYSFYEVAEACVDKEGSSSSSGGGGGCSMSFGAFNNIILLIIAAILKIFRNYLFIF
jgi:hypothetical protein